MKIEEFLLAHSVKPTANRCEILRVLLSHDNPMSIKELEIYVGHLDKSSIFRTLRIFVECHIIHEIEDGSGSLKYELCHSEHTNEHADFHPHFYCESCNQTVCLTNMRIPDVELDDDSVIHGINFVIKGICGNCARAALKVKH